MNEQIQIAYAEVWQVLKEFDKTLVMKIPIEILETIKKNRKKDFIVLIDNNDIFNKNNISKDALALLAYFNMEYWVDEEEKKELIDMYRKNESYVSTVKVEDVSTNIILKKEKEIINQDNYNSLPMKYEESLWIKIINKIKEKFKNFFEKTKNV